METKGKALLLGDHEKARWHSLTGIEEAITEILRGVTDVRSTDDYRMLEAERLQSFDLFISYTECWEVELPPEQRAGLLSFVANGGGVLVIHNGISVQDNRELKSIVGTRFTGHPPYTTLHFRASGESHPIIDGIETFTMEEEPYYFEPFMYDTTVLLEYEHDGQMRPAAWAHAYGLGRVVFLMPGHHLPSFQHETYRQLIRNSAKWLLRQT